MRGRTAASCCRSPPGTCWPSPMCCCTSARPCVRSRSCCEPCHGPGPYAGRCAGTAGYRPAKCARGSPARPSPNPPPWSFISCEKNRSALLGAHASCILRARVGHSRHAGTVDDLLQKRNDFGKQLLDITSAKAKEMGLRLLEVEIKDVMFPGEIKKIFTQVVKARQEGLAALERARGETAALRNLANAAHLIERNPALLQLRLLQVLGQSSGNTVVLGVPPQSGPIRIRTREAEEVATQHPLPEKEE